MEATVNARYAQGERIIPVATADRQKRTGEGLRQGLMVARRSFVDELPGVVIGIATLTYLITSLVGLA